MFQASPTDRPSRALTLAASGMIVAAAVTRLLPHPPNVTPILAIAIFGGGAFSSRRMAFAVPLASMLLSDLALELLGLGGLHLLMPVVYAAVAASVVLGFALRRRPDVIRTASVAAMASVVFYLSTNLAVWSVGTMCPRTWAGLGECYLAALPFFRNTLLSTVGYSVALFTAYQAAHSMMRTEYVR